MGTVNKSIADKIKAGNGYFMDDPRVIRIVEYENCFNGACSYGIEYERDLGKYAASEFVINPRVYWRAE